MSTKYEQGKQDERERIVTLLQGDALGGRFGEDSYALGLVIRIVKLIKQEETR